MAITHDGPRSGNQAAQHRRHLRLVPRSSTPSSSTPSPSASSAFYDPHQEAGTAWMETSFAAELLGAAPAEISSLAELRVRLSATCGAASDETLASWIDRLPNPQYLNSSPENVQSNVLKVLREIALEPGICSEVKESARNYMRERCRNSLELLSSKVSER